MEPKAGVASHLTVRDESSRYVLELRRLEDARTQTVRARFEELFRKHGLPGAIRSDNGPPFASVHGLLGLTRLSAWWLALGIDLERGRPGCPQDNGVHERLHLDIARELEAARLGEEQAVLDTWRETFNEERPHEALGMRCPAEVYTRSPRAYSGQIDGLNYPGMRPLRVTNAGCINLREQWIFISGALAGWSIGLEAISEAICDVWFGRIRLGQIDSRTMSFKSAEPTPLRSGQSAQEAA